ncbi:hypothetical protein RJT34_13389 [Clitoria ternatea]|uniref:RNase H type-1 domain-containing protein n=1 Tax=Clitoria ternatea TaxID=43366 RepID=A0AAN9JS06_CLITE
MLRDCGTAKHSWLMKVDRRMYRDFSYADLKQWILLNLTKNLDHDIHITFRILFHFKMVEWLSVFSDSKSGFSSLNKDVHISWQTPPGGWFKINIDGTMSNGRASCGGIVRNENGVFITAFSCQLEDRSVLQAELMGMIHDLQCA